MLPFSPARYGNPAAMGGGFTGPMDAYSHLFAAFSSRRLLSSFGGSPMRVRKDGTATEGDIGFNGAQDNIDTTALSTLVGSSDANAVTIYDQSGSALDATQGTSTLQPWIKQGGTVLTINGHSTAKSVHSENGRKLLTDTAAHNIGTGDFFFSFIVRITAGTRYAGKPVCTIAGVSGTIIMLRSTAVDTQWACYLGGATKNFNTVLANSTNYVLSVARESGTVKGWVNGTQEATTHANSSNIANGYIGLLAETNTSVWTPDDCVQEWLFFNNAMASSRAAIIANQKAYAGIA